jgi:hypothetical protein
MKDEALKLALEALESCDSNMDNIDQRFNAGKVESAITAIKQALAAPVQEPLEYWNAVEGWVKIDEVREHFDSVGCGTIYKTAGEGRVPLTAAQPAQQEFVSPGGGYVPAIPAQPAPVQQEPVAWVREHELPLAPGDAFSWVETFVHKTPLYTISPAAQRQWVGLTDEEIDKTHETQVWDARRSYARAIEAKLKEKNT